MSKRWLAVRLLLVLMCGYATACVESADSEASLDFADLLSGDGSEFEPTEVEQAVDHAIGSIRSIQHALEEGGTCCPDGNCVCRGGEPGSATLDRNGPFRTASYSRGFRIGQRFGGATVYYPTDATPPLSGVVMAPGYTARQSSIAAWGPFFASHGVILVTIDTRSVLDNVPQRAEALLDALASLKAENTRAGSPLQGKLSSDRFGLAGWSMGGGGTWLATRDNPELKTAVTLAGHNLSAGGGLLSWNSRVPTLMLNGANDLTVLGGLGQSESAYAAIAESTPKMLYVMQGEGHFSWSTPRTNGNASGRYVMAWQKVFLEGDTRYRRFLLERGPRAATWQTNVR